MGAHRAAWRFVGVGAHRCTYACTEGCIERCVCRYVDRCSCTEGRTEALGRFRQPGAGLHGTELFPSVPAGPSRPVQPRGPFVRAARCPGRAGGRQRARRRRSHCGSARRRQRKRPAPRPAPPRRRPHGGPPPRRPPQRRRQRRAPTPAPAPPPPAVSRSVRPGSVRPGLPPPGSFPSPFHPPSLPPPSLSLSLSVRPRWRKGGPGPARKVVSGGAGPARPGPAPLPPVCPALPSPYSSLSYRPYLLLFAPPLTPQPPAVPRSSLCSPPGSSPRPCPPTAAPRPPGVPAPAVTSCCNFIPSCGSGGLTEGSEAREGCKALGPCISLQELGGAGGAGV